MSQARSPSAQLHMFLCLTALVLALPLRSQEPLPANSSAAPAQAEQDRMLATMRDYADDYTSKLPNFICQQTVSQYEAGRKPNRWHKGDTLTSKLVFNAGREERKLELVNDKPITQNTHAYRAPLTTAGEFGMWLNNIFDPVTQAKFSWAGWQDLGGKQVAKFDYTVSQEHSTLSLTRSDLAKAIIAYHGSVFADPASGKVWRIMSEASDIPESVKTRSTATIIDYDAVKIGTQSYLLPVKAEVLMVTDTSHIRNEMQFDNYRKFEAESTIKFGGENDPATPPTAHP